MAHYSLIQYVHVNVHFSSGESPLSEVSDADGASPPPYYESSSRADGSYVRGMEPAFPATRDQGAAGHGAGRAEGPGHNPENTKKKKKPFRCRNNLYGNSYHVVDLDNVNNNKLIILCRSEIYQSDVRASKLLT